MPRYSGSAAGVQPNPENGADRWNPREGRITQSVTRSPTSQIGCSRTVSALTPPLNDAAVSHRMYCVCVPLHWIQKGRRH
jgi:hypothetical protein